MLKLVDLQTQFMDYIYKNELSEGLANSIAADKQHRLQVYQTTTRLILADNIQKTFPITTRLVGEEFMSFAADHYIQENPLKMGDATFYEAQFPEFLGGFEPVKEHPYLPDFAQLEWLKEVVYYADEQEMWTLKDIESLSAEAFLALPVQVSATVKWMKSDYPVVEIHDNFKEGGTEEAPQMENNAACVLVNRTEGKVAVHQINEGFYDVLECLSTSQILEEALEKSACEDQEKLQGMIQDLFKYQILVKEKDA